MKYFHFLPLLTNWGSHLIFFREFKVLICPNFKAKFMYSLYHGMLELEKLSKITLSHAPDAETSVRLHGKGQMGLDLKERVELTKWMV